MKHIYKEILENTAKGNIEKNTAVRLIRLMKEAETEKIDDIAIIGMAVKYPKAENLEQFWINIRNGVNCIDSFPKERKENVKDYLRFINADVDSLEFRNGSYINEIDEFDPQFFNISNKEAQLLDPNQRLFLENVYHTIEDSGYINKIKGTKTGVFVGFANELRDTYIQWIAKTNSEDLELSVAGNLSSIIPARISFLKDLKGPSMLIDSACSSSLTAVHFACNAIKNGDCSMAIVGGVRINLLPLENSVKIGIESSDGKTRTFDKRSDGTGSGEGVASILLKPLKAAVKDKDHIYAVIKGSAVNQDGTSAGITAPNVESQTDVLVQAWKNAGINPEEISFIEAHGTGTKLGDPIEIEGINAAFSKFTSKKQFCAIGSIKSNLGHLYEAAGITGIIKAALSLYNREIPQTLNFHEANPKIEFEKSAVYVNDTLKKCDSSEKTLLCGVSAFGFSGTNCHVVLGEAPKTQKDLDDGANTSDGKYEIITISAKTKRSLADYIDEFGSFLLKNGSNTLAEIAYSMNTCKEKFEYRIAIITDSKQDLYNKIKRINTEEFKPEKDHGIFCKYHNLVYESRKKQSDADITITELDKLNAEAVRVLQQSSHTEKLLEKLAELYVSGADIEWEKYYQIKRQKISLPLYSFEKNKYWITINKPEREDHVFGSNILHPLVEHLYSESIDEDVYITDFSAEKHFVLKDHVIMGMNIIPGTTYIETANFIGNRYFSTNKLEIKNLNFTKPLMVKAGQTKRVQTVIKKRKDGISFKVVSKNDDNLWDEHASGEISEEGVCVPSVIDMEQLRKKFTDAPTNIDQNKLTEGFIKFGPRWLNFKKLYRSAGCALGELELDESFAGDLKIYKLHPSMMDVAVNIVSLTLGERYLPLSYDSIQIFGFTPRKFYSYVEFKKDKLNGETIHFNLMLLDEKGHVFIKIQNYVLKKVHEFQRIFNHNSFYSKLSWVEKNLPIAAGLLNNKNIAVIGGNHIKNKQLIKRLEAYGAKVNEVILGIELKNEAFTIGREEDYTRVLPKLENLATEIIIYIPSNNMARRFLSDGHPETLCEDLYSCFHLLHQLGKGSNPSCMKFIVLAESLNDVDDGSILIDPINSALYAMLKSAGKEQSNVTVKAVDLECWDNLEQAVKELDSDDDCTVSVYRNKRRWTERIEKMNIEEIPYRSFAIKDSGTYLISGGIGGIGLEIAKYLSGNNAVNIVLLGRRPMPEKKDWDRYIEKNSDFKIRRAIETFKKIESNGSKVCYEMCDVSKPEQLNATIKKIRNKFHRINGVIHAAGNAGDGFIINKNLETFKNVVNPKIIGAVLLNEATKVDCPDFFVMFSSVAAILSLPGQSDYTAGNSFLDAYAEYEAKHNCNILSINWPSWSETGMAVEHNAVFDTLFKPIDTKEALYCFDQLLKRKVFHAIVGKWVYNKEIYDTANLNVSKEIKNILLSSKVKSNVKSMVTNVSLKGRNDNSYTRTEREIGAIWGRVLGFDEINVYDSFYDLGGDSILAVRINNLVNKKFNTNISVSDLLNYMTISDLAQFLDGKLQHSGQKNSADRIEKAGEMEFYPVTFEQKSIIFASQASNNQTLYNIPVVFKMTGNFDYSRIEAIIKQLIKRHEALRTHFLLKDGEVVQKVEKEIDFSLERIPCAKEQIDKKIKELITGFSLEEAPLFRAKVLESDDGEKYFFLDIHHVIADGYSFAIFLRDFINLYNNIPLDEITINYLDYSVWQKKSLQNGAYLKQSEYWAGQLSCLPDNLELNPDFIGSSNSDNEGKTYRFDIKKDMLSKIRELSKKHSVTLYSVLLSALYILLSRQSGQYDIVIGSPTSGRSDVSLENIMGMFVNTLPIRICGEKEQLITDLLAKIQQIVTEGLKNQNFIYEQVVNLLKENKPQKLYNVLFTLQNLSKNIAISDVGMPDITIDLGDLRLETYPFEKDIAKEDLNFEIIEKEEELECYFEYSTALFKEKTIRNLSLRYMQILKQIIDNTELPVREIQIISDEEKNKLLYRFNGKHYEFNQDKLIYRLIEESAEKYNDKVAIKCASEQVTYKELNERANQLARLFAKRGVLSEDLMVLLLPRGILMVEVILALWKIGAAYIPMDLNYPLERIKTIVDDSQAKYILSESFLVDEELSETFKNRILKLDLHESEIEKEGRNNLSVQVDKSSLAYVIYTSGSTGKPKGVMIEQIGMLNHIYAKVLETNMDSGTIIVENASQCFDISVWQFFAALTVGGTVNIYPNNIIMDVQLFTEKIAKDRVTVLEVVPSFLNIMLSVLEKNKIELKSLKYLFVTGESVQSTLVKKWFSLYPSIKMVNAYGPTEASDDITHYVMDKFPGEDTISIGSPLINFSIYIVDDEMRLCPIGVKGEICVSGIGVGRGYLNNPERTNQSFFENYYDDKRGYRLFKTGDLGAWREDGTIQFFGRKDYQVKIRGFRIELGEIESKLSACPGIKEAAVVDWKKANGEKYLCGYVTSLKPVVCNEIKSYLRLTLPDYMIPDYIVELDKMPLSSNGKINRKKLAKPDENSLHNKEYIAPSNSIEKRLEEIWKDILGIEQVSVTDNFFELGGQSLNGIAMLSRIQIEFNVKVSFNQLFEFETLSDLASYIMKAEKIKKETIEVLKKADYYEVSSAQKRLLILNEIDPDDLSYNNATCFEIKGALDKERIEKAFAVLVQNQDAFRTRFAKINDEYVQIVDDTIDLNIKYIKCSEVTKEMFINSIRPFDLHKAPLIRIIIFEISETESVLFVDAHHIIADGVSLAIMMQEFLQIYNGKDEFKKLPIQYKDFAAWQNKKFENGDFDTQEEFWVKKYEDCVPVLNLPTDYPRNSERNTENGWEKFELSCEFTEKIQKFAIDAGVTPFMILYSAYAILISRYSQQDDIVIGVPASCRNHEDLQKIIGIFINVLPLRNKIDGNSVYKVYLNELKNECLESFENQDYPYEKIVDKVNVRKEQSRNSLVEIMFAMEDIGDSSMTIDSLEIKQKRINTLEAKYDICLYASKNNGKTIIEIEYSQGLYKRETIKRMGNHYINLLRDLLENPNKLIKNLTMLSDNEKKTLLTDFNSSGVEYPKNTTIHELFEKQVLKTPDNIAVIDEKKSLTYKQLNEKSNALARKLRKKGIGRNDIVGIMVKKSLELFIGIFGVLKAGGSYMPIDTKYPKNKVQYMLSDSEAKLLLTTSQNELRFTVDTMFLDDPDSYNEDMSNLENINEANDLVYIIYTSGSTGNPKGVMIKHCSLQNYIEHCSNYFSDGKAAGNMPLYTSISFDLTVTTIFKPLLSGGVIRIYNETDTKSLMKVMEDIFKGENDAIKITPAHLRLVNELNISESKIKKLIVGGEELKNSLAKKIIEKLGRDVDIYNEYGPTESTVGCIVYKYIYSDNEDGDVLIGKPVNNTQAYVLDKNMELLPIGIPGQLYLGGDSLAKGYLNRPELTKERFVENPFKKGERLYKTGDLVKWLSDGNMVFLGRIDNMVKIRGFRIEPEEIANKILMYPNVKEAVVLAKEDNNQDKYLCAYYVSDAEIETETLKNYLREILPYYMIPQYFVMMESMPLTNNGKIDKSLLPEPQKSERNFKAPENEKEKILVQIWENVLGLNHISINDNFFEIGGNSLTASIITARINNELGVNVPLREIFSLMTIKAIAQYIMQAEKNSCLRVKANERQDSYPLSSAQFRMFVSDNMAKNTISYNIPIATWIEGNLDYARLEEAINKLMKRHEALRTSISYINGVPRQQIKQNVTLPIEHYEAESQAQINKIIKDFIRPFNLSEAPLLRVALIKVETNKHIMLFDMHHIISDGISLRNIMDDFMAFYMNQPVEELKVCYGDYVIWQQNFLNSQAFEKEEQYWLKVFKDKIPKLNLPKDFNQVRTPLSGESATINLDRNIILKLSTLAKNSQTTQFMIMLAVYNILLAKYTGEEDIAVLTPVSGRRDAALEPLVGVFINSVPMRNFPVSNKSFLDFLNEVKNNTLSAFEAQDYPLERLISKLGVDRENNGSQPFSTMFTYQNIELPDVSMEGLKFRRYEFDETDVKFDIELEISDNQSGMSLKFKYSRDLFKRETIVKMLNDMVKIIKIICENKNIIIGDIQLVETNKIKEIMSDVSSLKEDLDIDFDF